MKNTFAQFCKFSAVLAAVLGGNFAMAEQAPNPRSATVANVASKRSEGDVVKRGSGTSANVVSNSSRSAIRRPTAVVSRAATTDKKKSARTAMTVRTATPAIMRNASVSRAATTVNASRAAGMTNSARARNAVNAVDGLARAAKQARATAVFSDMSKIGGGYAACRESYATCMDQFCANANDTYRRCYCSSRFTDFRDMEDAMDQAKILLQEFEDNNLNAVDKTAEEVNAMYSATVGEAAIKKDTSGAQKILNEIGDLLSGKKKAAPQNNNGNSTSLGVISLDFSTDMGDIWGGGDVFSGGSSMFDNSGAIDMTSLEGQQLYNASNKQCVQVIQDSCESSAVLNMATSAYNIMITQDCNMYEKSLNKKREQVMSTVRQAEKILRDARLEEYRAHNSQDVNECITKVQTAMTAETACGANYKRCLDYSGVYINPETGEPIYSQRLFEMTNLITLSGAGKSKDGKSGSDILGQNTEFNNFLDQYRNRAATALDSCRGIADTVWTEFKRMALIQIAQAQDAKIEEVKMSCVKTMAECYDTQSNALKSFDNTTAKTAGAISAYAAKSMCQDKVVACASLYGNNSKCKFDGNGVLLGAAGKPSNDGCGLTALLAFVDSVDEVRVAEGCETAMDSHLKELCTPAGSGEGSTAAAYPWRCRLMSYNDLALNLYRFAYDNCADPNISATDKDTMKNNLNNKDLTVADARTYLNGTGGLPLDTMNKVERALDDIKSELDSQLAEHCEELGGYWIPSGNNAMSNANDLAGFYTAVYGKGSSSSGAGAGWGKCVENSTRVLCEAYNSNVSAEAGKTVTYATYNVATDECEFTPEWYQQQCSYLGENSEYKNGVCYVEPDEVD